MVYRRLMPVLYLGNGLHEHRHSDPQPEPRCIWADGAIAEDGAGILDFTFDHLPCLLACTNTWILLYSNALLQNYTIIATPCVAATYGFCRDLPVKIAMYTVTIPIPLTTKALFIRYPLNSFNSMT